MSSDLRWERIGKLFDSALERPRGERTAWLRDVCQDEPELVQEIELLLDAHAKAGGILDRSLDDLVSAAFQDAQAEATKELQVGPYTLLQEIGRGGMGVVFKAHDPRLDRFVALKFLQASGLADEGAKARFMAEAKAASALDHPNICTIYDVGETAEGQLYIAMAFYEGQTLTERIEEGPLPIGEGLDIGIQVAKALARAHEAGIVHRDIKPSNIMLTERGETKILDFGIAKLEGSSAVTQPGVIMGTPAYMSPEQLRGDPVDQRTDIWSLGAVLYRILSGRRPFPGAGPREVIYAIADSEPPRLRDIRPDAPEALDGILRRALSKSPEKRYARAQQLHDDLVALRSTGTVATDSVETGRAGRLQLPITSFVGRERELEQVTSLLAETRLVTLTGPGGTGKTRLSQQVGATAGDGFQEVCFVSFALIADPGLVASTLAQGLGVRESASELLMERLKEFIGTRSLLLLLDNFEQVVSAAPIVAELLEACPRLKVIATSRVPLRLSGEHEFPVRPLQLPDLGSAVRAEELGQYSAVALFMERARAVMPAFELTEENAEAVAELCVRLDGLPLAIELAAARIKMLPPRAIQARLESRLDLLKGGPRDRPARHQTLRHAIAWSYDLLEDEQRRLFRCLAAFAGGFTLEAAEAVTSDAGAAVGDLLDGVAALLDHSLLRQEETGEGEPRFSMLETIRAFGLECLESEGESQRVFRGHANFFVELGEAAEPHLTGTEQAVWMDRLEAEHDNVRAAVSWSIDNGEATLGLRMGAALWRFWLARSHMNEGFEWLGRTLRLQSEGVPDEVRARALNAVGTLAHNLGDNEDARAYLEESLALFRKLNDERGVARVLNNLGWAAGELSDLETARALSNEALALNRQLDERRGIAVALNNLGWIATYQGDLRAARAYHQEHLALRRALDDQRGIAFALACLAWAEQYHGDYEKALELQREALQIARAVNDQILIGLALLTEGEVALDLGDYERADGVLEEALRNWVAAGNLSGRAWTLGSLGRLAVQQGDFQRAEAVLMEAIGHWKKIGGKWGEALALFRLARVVYERGDRERAISLCAQSLRLRHAIGDKRGMAECLERIAELHGSRGEPERSALLLAAASKLRESTQAPLPKINRKAHQQLLKNLRKRLGRAGFARAWSDGERLELDRAVALALGDMPTDDTFEPGESS